MNAPDLVVVGAGPAGLACAIAAAEHGRRVLLLDKSDDIGGTLQISTGQMSAAGTRRQRDRGIEDSPDRHFEEIMRRSGAEVDPVLLRLAVQEAPHTIDWLEEIGLELDPRTPARYLGHEPYEVSRTYWPARGGAGPAVLAVLRVALAPACQDGRVVLSLRHRVVELVRDAHDRVHGVIAEGPGGPVSVTGDAVVLATGGYGADPELYAELSPDQPPLLSATRHTSTGDGLRMARRVGAQLRSGEHQLQTVGVLESAPGSGRADEPAVWATLNPNFRAPRELHVNAAGRRFLAEDDPSPDRRERAVMAQPGQQCWVLFDDAALEADPFIPSLGIAGLRRLTAAGTAGWSAADPRALARAAGINPDGLERTISEWNSAVAADRDPLWRAHPGPTLERGPFHAVLVHAGTVITFGGVAADGNFRALRSDGSPITGLYVAGEVLGAAALSGNYFWGGMAVTPALSFGRIIGRALAGR